MEIKNNIIIKIKSGPESHMSRHDSEMPFDKVGSRRQLTVFFNGWCLYFNKIRLRLSALHPVPCCGLSILFPIKNNQISLEKWLTPGLGQETNKMNLGRC